MIIREAILAVLGMEADDNQLQKALSDVRQGGDPVNSGAEYSSADHKQVVDLAAIELLKTLLSLPDITEGGLSVRYDKKYMAARLSQLEAANGLAASNTPRIKSISSRW